MPVLFAIVGATGIGKSDLSLELAERYGAEIIQSAGTLNRQTSSLCV